jgi:integrating conjugative element protein (TIGR03759 family)
MRRAAILLLLALHAAVAHSQTRTTTTATMSAQATSTQVDGVERRAAQYWGLSLEDFGRYQALMKGMRGAISDPRISPIEVLGIHARDEAERRKFAEMFARLMAEDTQRILQFQLEYDRAFKRLHPSLVALDFGTRSRRPEGLQAALASAPTLPFSATPNVPLAAGISRTPGASAGDRVLVFTRDDCSECDDLVQRATTLARQGVAVDLYVVGAHSGDEAQRYARRVALDPALVSDRRVTLNVDGGTFARVLPQQPGLPALVRKRGESLVQLATTEL